MLKQLHQFTQTIEGNVFTFCADITSQIPHMEQALTGFLQFLGQIKAQQEAIKAAEDTKKAESTKVEPIKEEQPPA